MAKNSRGGRRSSSQFKALSSSTEHDALISDSRRMWGADIVKQRGYVRTGISFEVNSALRRQDDDVDITKIDLGGKNDRSGNGRWDFNKITQNMDELTSKAIPGNQNRLLTRFVGDGWAQNALGVTDLNQLTTLDFKGTVFKEKGFTSTSTIASQNVFTSRPIKLEIEAPKGTRGFVADNRGESEVVLPRNSQFKILGTKKENGNYVIRVRVKDTPNNSRGFTDDPLS